MQYSDNINGWTVLAFFFSSMCEYIGCHAQTSIPECDHSFSIIVSLHDIERVSITLLMDNITDRLLTSSAHAERPPMVEEEKFLPPPGYSDHVDHHRNFLDAVRSRKPVVEDAVFGFRAAAPALLSNVSYFEQRICEWNPESLATRS